MFLKQCDCHCEILLRERVEKFSKLLFAEFCELFALAAGFPLVFANLWYLTESRLGRPRGAAPLWEENHERSIRTTFKMKNTKYQVPSTK